MLRITEEALTFDDVLLVPAASNVLPGQVAVIEVQGAEQRSRGMRATTSKGRIPSRFGLKNSAGSSA